MFVTVLTLISTLYCIEFLMLFQPYCTTRIKPVLRFSPLYHPYIPFPLHPAFTLSLRCTSLHFPSLHFTALFNTLYSEFHVIFAQPDKNERWSEISYNEYIFSISSKELTFLYFFYIRVTICACQSFYFIDNA